MKEKINEQVRFISKNDLLKAVAELPKGYFHYSKLTIDTLHSALKNLDKNHKKLEILLLDHIR